MTHTRQKHSRISFVMAGEGRCIQISPRRPWVLITILALWWLLLVQGGITAQSQLERYSNSDPLGTYVFTILFYGGLIFWLHATCVLTWLTLGTETIAILGDNLHRTLSVLGLYRTKAYALSSIGDLRWVQHPSALDSKLGNNDIHRLSYGVIKFDTGGKTVTFAKDVTQSEGDEIIDAICFAAGRELLV